jgi:hypothetical protein
VVDDQDLDITLYIKKNLELPVEMAGVPGGENWTQEATQICLSEGVMAFDSSYTDGGVLEPLPLVGGKLYVEYRAWYTDQVGILGTVDGTGDIDALLPGPLSPDNPLKWAVLKAQENSNGVAVHYIAVGDPADTDNWELAVSRLEDVITVYGLVPLTRDATVISLLRAHIENQSSPLRNRWRVLWISGQSDGLKSIVAPEEAVLATLSDDPQATGTQYTILDVPAGDAEFITRGTRAGDTVRYLYSVDETGETAYESFTVDAVLSEDTLRLVTGHSAPVSIPQKVEVWRTLTATEEASEIGVKAGAYGDRRVMYVWPDKVFSGGVETEGWFLTAALAGLASGVPPNQGLTRVVVAGFDNMDRSAKKFNRSQLDTMAGSGVWIVTQDLDVGTIFNRHAVTTADYNDINLREEMFSRNLDNISMQFAVLYEPYIGKTNKTRRTKEIIAGIVREKIQELEDVVVIEYLGPQIISGELTDIRDHATLRDRLVIVTTFEMPYPLNNVDHTIIV